MSKELLETMMKAHTELQKTVDEKIEAVRKGFSPNDYDQKIDKINEELTSVRKALDEQTKAAQRPLFGNMDTSPEAILKRSAFTKFVRGGMDARNLTPEEIRALSSSSDENGGVFVTPEMDNMVTRVAQVNSVMRRLSDVKTIGKASLKFRVKKSGLAARWVGEGEAGGETNNQTYAELEIFAEEMEVEPWVYNTTLDDADYDLTGDIMEEAGIAFGEGEGSAFIDGNGVKKPRGILAYPTVANANYAWGKVGFIVSGASGDFASSNPGDNLINLLHSLKPVYRNGASLLMNDTTLAKVRQIKDGTGNFYLFNPDSTGKFAGFVLGAPVEIDDNMPVLASNSLSIAYGDFKRAYRIVDRTGMSLIRDNVTTKGSTKFNFRKRVGGGLKNYEAIKLMKFST